MQKMAIFQRFSRTFRENSALAKATNVFTIGGGDLMASPQAKSGNGMNIFNATAADGKNKMKVISPSNYFLFNQIRPSVTCGTVGPHSTVETVRNIVRNATTQQGSYLANCAKHPEGPLCFRGEGRRCFHNFRYNHFGLFAPLRAEQAVDQLSGSVARRFYRRDEKPPRTHPDRNRNKLDHRRRLLAAKYELRRNLYKALCRDPNLPSAMRVKYRCKLSNLPRNSSFTRVRNRCIFSGRPRGVYKKFRMSRIVFRTLANQGQLIGIKKASW
ncbi:external alternative NAD(P)H-ubiquinone oxidoreductase B2, mitochondrial-like [Salvia miltiorrhiza]|uniref:external alternative NAD(P)H-ubiquinone oxidoreductase B2, mitochondrial-like n=1 Tax=Salvia miltiorrhiza TaxID=226208 RepID=UPI0025AC42E6|nr:external alternative NAD(P)H-ubiquinone oxidoreductase B2, mitochondrial-like [Salvia miltiorrhiza]